MVTDGVAHVTSVRVLRDFRGTTQPGGETTLQRCIVGRNGGARATKAPEDAIRPRRFPLFSTERRARKADFQREELAALLQVQEGVNAGLTWCRMCGCPRQTCK